MTNKQAYAGLLPCPFCGGEPEDCPQNSDRRHPTRKGEWCVYIWCVNCDARGPEKQEPSDAIEAWNTRPEAAEAISSLLKRVGELEGALEGLIVFQDANMESSMAWRRARAALNSDAPLSIGEGL